MLHEETQSQYLRRLTRTFKLKKLGGGAFSEVYTHPVYHNVAVKLVLSTDPKAVLWLHECQKRPHNPWLPKVIGISKMYLHGDEDIAKLDPEGVAADELRYAVFMEKLRPIKSYEYKAIVKKLLRGVPDECFVPEEVETGIRRGRLNWKKQNAIYKNYQFDRTREELEDYTPDELGYRTISAIAKNTTDPDVRELCELLVRYDASDLHDGNVLMRGDQPVFTDPAAS